jgi:hypothetical protein
MKPLAPVMKTGEEMEVAKDKRRVTDERCAAGPVRFRPE